MENKDKDIPLSNKPWDPATITYDQLGEYLGKTLSTLHEKVDSCREWLGCQ